MLEILAQSKEGQINLQPLSMHCSDYSSAIIYRERANIDFLIEIPNSNQISNTKGIVVTVELKIDASESNDQLPRYFKQVDDEYPKEDWERLFVFLTLDATAPSEANLADWIPVSLLDIINRFDEEVHDRDYAGEALALYRNYSTMIRKNLLENEELAQLSKNIWAKHKEALEILYDYWPDLQGEILDWVADNPSEIIKATKKATGYTIREDTSSSRLLRYCVEDWLELPGFCDGDKSWVESSSIMVLELADWGDGRLRLSFVLGLGDSDIKLKIYEEVLKLVDAQKLTIGRRTKTVSKWKHLSGTDIQSKRDYVKYEEDDVEIEQIGKNVAQNIARFLKANIDLYNGVLQSVLNE